MEITPFVPLVKGERNGTPFIPLVKGDKRGTPLAKGGRGVKIKIRNPLCPPCEGGGEELSPLIRGVGGLARG